MYSNLTNKSCHVWVCHQAREDLDQLSLEVGMELGLYVEPVHVGEDGDYAAQGMEVLYQCLHKKT